MPDKVAPPSVGTLPARWEDHQAEAEARRKAREANRKTHLDCCDAAIAARLEAQKPTYEWRVECTLRRPDGKGRVKLVERSEKVVAQTERDAWAAYCDLIQDWPSPGTCDRKITRLGKPTNARE
jgi:hypothetical protein